MSGYYRHRQPYMLFVTTRKPRAARLVHSKTGERVPVTFVLATSYGVYVTPERDVGMLFLWDEVSRAPVLPEESPARTL